MADRVTVTVSSTRRYRPDGLPVTVYAPFDTYAPLEIIKAKAFASFVVSNPRLEQTKWFTVDPSERTIKVTIDLGEIVPIDPYNMAGTCETLRDNIDEAAKAVKEIPAFDDGIIRDIPDPDNLHSVVGLQARQSHAD